jgi:hypothetical protein
MKVAFGLKSHSGWAALVVLGTDSREPQVIERRRMELVEAKDASWAKQLYHSAERMHASASHEQVARGLASARRIAVREMRSELTRTRERGHEVVACAVLTSEPMPDWTVEEILAVHFRMHKAEGVLFRDALARAGTTCGVRLVEIIEKKLNDEANRAFGASAARVRKMIASLGKVVGPPWGSDQKSAALAALIALQGRTR